VTTAVSCAACGVKRQLSTRFFNANIFFLKRAGELRIRYIKIEEKPMV
jgi:hypothetical protein